MNQFRITQDFTVDAAGIYRAELVFGAKHHPLLIYRRDIDRLKKLSGGDEDAFILRLLSLASAETLRNVNSMQ